jgi:integrase/recombinase XerD
MRRASNPQLSTVAQAELQRYAQYLRSELDLSPATVRNYLSDLCHFAAWCEAVWETGEEPEASFIPQAVTTPTITRYRSSLQTEAKLRPASVNRSLISIKRYCAWAVEAGLLPCDASKPVKLVAQEPRPPRHLTDKEEEALIAAASAGGQVRDYTLLVLMLHTGLRAREVCGLRTEHVRLAKRSGILAVWGKRNKYREIPLNATARTALAQYLPTVPEDGFLFPSRKTGSALTERALGQLVHRYAQQARVPDLSPHDLRHRFGYRMAETVPLHRLAQIMGHDSLDTTRIYTQGTPGDLQREVEKIAWA